MPNQEGQLSVGIYTFRKQPPPHLDSKVAIFLALRGAELRLNPAANLYRIDCTVAVAALRSIISDRAGRRILL